jgi:hypothetical protein
LDLNHLRRTAVLLLVGLVLATEMAVLLVHAADLSARFFVTQDILGAVLAIAVIWWIPRLDRLGSRLIPVTAAISARPARTIGLLAVAVGLTGWLGHDLVFSGQPLSADEAMALFDAQIFRHGALIAPLPPSWRPFDFAMAPTFQIFLRSGAAWSSSYYPVNALLHAAMDSIGLRAATGGLLAALSIGLCYRLARRLWPETSTAGLVAALLLASSSQLLLTAMTTYAMSAHLALNLLWLNLFLARGRLSQILALLTAAAATGLHQLAFHPLFAAPFVLQLWLDRRLGRAVFHTLGYLALALLWPHYWDLALGSAHLTRAHDAATVLDPARIALSQLESLGPHALQWQLENLCRAVSWQNPLTMALFVVGVPLAVRAGGVERSLVLGLVLTLALVTLIIPYQGHGWGYRYLHGLLGSVVLIAVRGATAIWPRAAGGGLARRALPVAVLSGLICAGVLIPIRMLQARGFSAPYARAEAVITHAAADVVLVSSDGLAFGDDLVRNDPWLRRGPVVMSVVTLPPAFITRACGLGRVAIFDRTAGQAMGILPQPLADAGSREGERFADLTQLQATGRCGSILRADGGPAIR